MYQRNRQTNPGYAVSGNQQGYIPGNVVPAGNPQYPVSPAVAAPQQQQVQYPPRTGVQQQPVYTMAPVQQTPPQQVNHQQPAQYTQQPQQAPVARAPQYNTPAPAAKTANADTSGPQKPVTAKIARIDAKDKVMDFTSKMIKAYPQDFANIHGQGGKNHAMNSTIAINISDYSKGTGEKSVYLSYNLDVEIFDFLYRRADDAWSGKLTDLQMRTTGPSQPSFVFEDQKVNSYQAQTVNGVEIAPVSFLSITHDRNARTRCPWIIQITNGMAPIKRYSKGSITYDGKQIQNSTSVYIPVSEKDFYKAMVRVTHFINAWEHRSYQLIDRMCSEEEAWYEQQRNGKTAAGR